MELLKSIFNRSEDDPIYKKGERKEIYRFFERLTERIHEDGIANIIFMDRSARTAWVGVNQYWKQNFSSEKKPGMYFVNPDGFDVIDRTVDKLANDNSNLLIQAIDRIVNLRNLDEILASTSNQTFQEIQAEFTKTFPDLIKEKDKPLLLFDTCSHSGNTLDNVKMTLEKLGFSDVKFTTAGLPDSVPFLFDFDDFIHLEDAHLNDSCQPFNGHLDRLTEKGTDIVSDVNKKANKNFSHKNRKEIKDIIQKEGK